jgi:Tfp pilus assembly protein PilF
VRALDDYDRAHPSGTLTEEALALRVRAARLAGDDAMAAAALTKLETRFPTSVQLPALKNR